jgi:hypothetical protein
MSTIRTEKEVQKERIEKLIQDCEKSIIDSIIRPFGLNSAIFHDIDGGNLPTIHNAKDGVFPNETYKNNYEQLGKDYDRTKYDAPYMRKSLYMELHERLNRGETVISPYTGEPLEKNNLSMDHVIPLREMSKDQSMHLFFSQEDRKKLANAESNLVPFEKNVNSAKNDKNAVVFAESERGKEFGVDIAKAKELDREARIGYEIEKTKKIATAVATDVGIASLQLSVRQALGEVLIRTTRASLLEVKDAYKNGLITELSPSVTLALQERGIRVTKAAMHSLRPALDSGLQGAIAGAISEFVTWLINNFYTTAANLVRIIREGFLKLVNAIKILMFPPKGMSTEDSVREATKIVAGVLGLALGIAAEEALKAALLQVPMINVAAAEIAAVSAGILTGICLAVTAYLIDRFFDEMAMPFETQSLELLVSNNRLQEIFFERSMCVSEVYRQTSCDFSIILKDLAESKLAISNANTTYGEMLRDMEESSKKRPPLLS